MRNPRLAAALLIARRPGAGRLQLVDRSDGESATDTTGPTGSPTPAAPIVFNGQGNNLDAYDVAAAVHAPARDHARVADDPKGLDINAQICFFPDEHRDRVHRRRGHRPDRTAPQGWGIFELTGNKVGELSAQARSASSRPTYQGSRRQRRELRLRVPADGRIAHHRRRQPGRRATATASSSCGSRRSTRGDGRATARSTSRIATAGRASASTTRTGLRGVGPPARPRGVWRYTGPFPTSTTPRGGCGKKDATGAPLADDGARRRSSSPPGANDLVDAERASPTRPTAASTCRACSTA